MQPITMLLVPLLTLLFRLACQQVLQMKMQFELFRLRTKYQNKPIDLLEVARELYETYGVKSMALR